jgi:hypothetical protein
MAQVEWGYVDNERWQKVFVHTHEGFTSVWMETQDTITSQTEMIELTQEQAIELATILLNAAGKKA